MNPTNNSHFKKLLKNININTFLNIFRNSVIKLSPFKDPSYRRHVCYTLDDYIYGIIDVLKNYSSWNSYTGKMKGDTLRKKHNEWSKLGIYDDIYVTLLSFHLKKNKCKKLKYQSMDSTNIRDINGNKMAKYNKTCKNQKGKTSKCIKINTLVDAEGIPISVTIHEGNKYDSTLYHKTMNKILIENDPKKYQNNNQFKQYFITDKGYDTKKIINNATKRGYNCIIPQNKRRIINKKLLRIMNNKQLRILKKRHIVENFFSWLKRFSKIKCLYERNIKSYKGLIFLAFSIILARRI